MVKRRQTSIVYYAAFVAALLLNNDSVTASKARVRPAISPDIDFSVSSPTEPKWISKCSQLAPCCSILCSLAPLPTILQVARKKSTGNLPLLPYSSMVANGFIWMLYGFLQDLPSVWSANMVGAILGVYYFKEFKSYCPVSSSNLPGTARQHKLIVSWIIFANLFVVFNMSKTKAADIIGKEAVFMYVVLFASPLAALKVSS